MILPASNPIIDYPGDLHYHISGLIFKMGKYGNHAWVGFGVFFVTLLIFLTITDLYSNKPVHNLRKYLHSETLFLLTIFLSILILRLPNLILFEQNPDESQWIVEAGTLWKDFRYWLSVDGGGPLNTFPLTLINLLGGSLNYTTVRLFGLLFCIIPSVILIYLAFKTLFDERVAKIIILPLVVCMSFMNFSDIIAYNREHMSMLLISISIFLYCRMITLPDKRQLIYLFILGLTLGSVPYAKLQSAPIALGMAIFCCLDLLFYYKSDKKRGSKRLMIFIIGGLVPSIFVLFYLISFAIFEVFWQSYILRCIAYAQKGLSDGRLSWSSKISILPLLIWTTPHTKYYFISLFISASVSSFILVRWRRSLTSIDYRLTFLSLLMVLTSYYCIVQPGNFFHHYQILFIIPAMFFSGSLIGILFRKPELDVRLRKILLISFVLISVVYPSFYTLRIGSKAIWTMNLYRGHFEKYGFEEFYNIMNRKSEVAKKVREYAQPNERMTIWGWMNHYYVETGLIQGTRQADSDAQISGSKQQDYYLKKYVSDLIRNKPVIFVDAVGPKSFHFNNAAQRHDNFPIVKVVIDADYDFVAEIEGVRIYVLKKNGSREKRD